MQADGKTAISPPALTQDTEHAMSQADSPNTTTLPRLSFASVRARRHHVTPLPAVQLAHHTLVAAIGAETPNHIVGYAADRFDIEERAHHLKTIFAAVHAYSQAIVKDTAHMSPVNIQNETGLLKDAGAVMNAVDKIIDDQARAAE